MKTICNQVFYSIFADVLLFFIKRALKNWMLQFDLSLSLFLFLLFRNKVENWTRIITFACTLLNVLGNEKQIAVRYFPRYKHYIHKAGDYIGVLRYIDLHTQKRRVYWNPVPLCAIALSDHVYATSGRCSSTNVYYKPSFDIAVTSSDSLLRN